GTVAGPRSRRYHGLLLVAKKPPAERVLLVAGLEAFVETARGRFPLSTQRYADDVLHPRGVDHLAAFAPEPWPTWRFALPDGTRLRQELFVPRGRPLSVLRWIREEGEGPSRLLVRPLLAGRFFHALMGAHPRDAAVRFDPTAATIAWASPGHEPGVVARTNGAYRHAPSWYHRFLLARERERGLDHLEDLFSPGELSFDLAAHEEGAELLFAPEGVETPPPAALRREEAARRRAFADPLHRAAEAYVVQRGRGESVIAGYPWFGDWGRDTFIALRGLCLAPQSAVGPQLDRAGRILREWAGAVSEGMLPNRFPDAGDTPEYNSVDASLWYVVVVGEYLRARRESGTPASEGEVDVLLQAARAIVEGYRRGTRYRIRVDEDGLVACGEPGVQLTWMDAKVGDWVVTPRIGKPVEIQALWVNALDVVAPRFTEYHALRELAATSFLARFPCAETGGLFDVIDADHEPGRCDASIRPNMLFAVGGLPRPLLDDDAARRVVDLAEEKLWTPLGMRSLDPAHPDFVGRYEGGVRQRDGSYHQGIAWGWLLGPFVEAWLRVRGSTDAAKAEARERFLAPLEAHLDEAGVGHVSEIADATPPFTPRGTPFQAWSVGELLRLRALCAR
ncbi:MAG TPA: amylo-alpha-1,6-glucosidase, partial [Polyangiaceae bacterium LLY-WYZ-15_(1-7)]|nr:amylo-alpha-1,6-glucosidase [Polyangiaceae bacterium LLY-WYZ-15_(1-7)]